MRLGFKHDYLIYDLRAIHPNLLYLLGCFVKYAADRKLPVEITRIIAAKIKGVSVSDTHAEGRAIDISVRGWSADQCLEAVDYFKDKYYDVGAISAKTGEAAPLVYHKGTDWHFHLQVRR